MGIVEHELAAGELEDDTSVTVELNKGNVVHLHFGDVRVDFTPDEFLHFATVVGEGLDELRERKYE